MRKPSFFKKRFDLLFICKDRNILIINFLLICLNQVLNAINDTLLSYIIIGTDFFLDYNVSTCLIIDFIQKKTYFKNDVLTKCHCNHRNMQMLFRFTDKIKLYHTTKW